MLLELAKDQKRRGHDVTICAMYGEGALDHKARDFGIKVVHLHSSGKPLDDIKSLHAYLKNQTYDILHSHWSVWLATALAGFLRGIPRVHTHHSNQRRRLFIGHRIAKWFTPKIVILTPDVEPYIKKWVAVPARKLVVIPNGIDLSKIENAHRVEIDGIPADAPVVGMVARLSPPKDYATLIRAAKIVNDILPQVHFVAVGEGPQREYFQKEVESLQVKNFHFLGARLDVPSLLRRMDIKVLATSNEGLSLSLLEAMASGCVTIATDIPSNRFTLDQGKSGLLVPPKDPQSLAAAIERVLNDKELQNALRQNAAKRYLYFGSERMSQDYLELYSTLIRTKN